MLNPKKGELTYEQDFTYPLQALPPGICGKLTRQSGDV